MTRLKLSRPILFAALAGAVAMGACSLNPQPIPPGEQAGDGGDKFGETADSATPTAGPSDGGATGFDGDADADAGEDAGIDDAGDADTDAHDE